MVSITAWNNKKAQIKINVEIDPTDRNNLSKKSIADCLQTRPVDHRARLKRIRGQLEPETLEKIDRALKAVFGI